MHAILLAGGFGTRLKAVVGDVSKPLAPIQGRPFLAWLIESLARQGVTRITLSVHYQWQKVRDHFAAFPPPIPVDYAIEESALGTGGAMVFALTKHAAHAPVIVLNGDSFVRVDYRALYKQHLAADASLTMVLREVSDTGRYAQVHQKDGVITGFGPGEAGKAGLINAGVYVMKPDLFKDTSLPEAFSFELDFLPTRVDKLKPQAFLADSYFIDIGVPEDYARACKELPLVA